MPEYRFFDYPTVVVGDWYETDLVGVNAPWGAVEVVVIVRRTTGGRVELDLDTYDEDFEVWIEGARSFDYATVSVGRWLRSAPAILVSDHNAGEMLPLENTEPTPEQVVVVDSWPPPAPTRPDPWPSPASAFWSAGTCALGPRHAPGGDILFCTAPTSTNVRTYLDEFVAMLAPWYPWIGAAWEWAGDYRLVHSSESPCSRGSSGCAAIEGRDVDVYVAGDLVVRMARSEWGEVLLHELAHAFDHMRWFAHNEYTSNRFLTGYSEGLRYELFADALAANSMGEYAATRRYNGVGDVPHSPLLGDLLAVGEAVIEWCSLERCGVPRLARGIVWAHPSPPQASSSTATQTAAEIMHAAALERERALALAQALTWCSTRSYTIRFNVPTTDPVTGDLRTFEEMWAERERLRQEWTRECQDEARQEHETL